MRVFGWLKRRFYALGDRLYPELRSHAGATSEWDRAEAITVAGDAIGWSQRLYLNVMVGIVFVGPALAAFIAIYLAAVTPVLHSWRWHIFIAVYVIASVLAMVGGAVLYAALFRTEVRQHLRHTTRTGCPKCDHNLLGTIDETSEQVRCPECGSECEREELRFICSSAPPSKSDGRTEGWSWERTADSPAARWLGALLLLLGYGQWITTTALTGPTVYSLVLLLVVSALGIRLALAGRNVWRRNWADGVNSGFALALPAVVGGYPPSIVGFGLHTWLPMWACIGMGLSCVGLAAQTVMSGRAKAKLLRMWEPLHRAGR
ncbi:MAG: zinc ribbon domain-containing protein [Phycisphaerales bacterium JB038]